ncbi:Hypothetical protein R9X50_00184400 [Acrodontium crateriforme]|uniref:Uncharacterized protein n=1 Tax=Acrodontium crateriforme TaxID=150365 RepID=A0AAQ3R8I5_9PEZI|nr:Hypothetical protein R9X50_00184400 [Acrodontium crateriforme]
MILERSRATHSIPAGHGWTIYGSAKVKAPAKTVYSILRDPNSYPKWNVYTPEINTATETNDFQVGEQFMLHFREDRTSRLSTVTCELLALYDEDMMLCWRGLSFPSFVLCPEKVQKVTDTENGSCLYEVWETFTGPLGWVAKWTMGEKLSVMAEGMANGLKKYVEDN